MARSSWSLLPEPRRWRLGPGRRLVVLLTALGAWACAGSSGTSQGPATSGAAAERPGEERWVGTWATALQRTEPRNLPTPAPDAEPTPENPGFAGNTLRQMVRVSRGGSRLRLRLSNEFGVEPVTFDAVHLAQSLGGGAIEPSTDVALSFGDAPSVTVAPGESITSDAFDFALSPLMDVAISMEISAQAKDVTGHPGSRTTSFLVPGAPASVDSMPDALRTAHWYFISGIDVLAEGEGASVAILGDSLTDGRGTTTDGNDRWPDRLAARLQEEPTLAHIGVLNMGIGGNAVLNGGIGPTGSSRFDRDVLERPGVEWCIILEGVNDIGNATSDLSGDLIATYREFIRKAHERGIKAYGATILPFKTNGYDRLDHLAQRAAVNEWIRTSNEFDAVIDLDLAVQDPADPDKLKDEFAVLPPAVGTDYLHLNPDGYRAMGDAVSLDLFR